MSASSSNKKKKIEEMSVDRLSELPDSILCYVLSFLEMKEAAITCLLSKRWQFLWTQLPGLRFEEKYCSDKEKVRKFVLRVHRTLAVCSRHNLERLEIETGFHGGSDETFASDFNVWTRFAVENKVKFFSLLVPGHHAPSQMMYSNPCWTSLRLGGCIMAPRGTIEWQSLTKLQIYLAKLNENTIDKIFSGCPILSSLDMAYCRGFNRLEVSSPSLRRLAIRDSESRGDLKISAPYVRTLEIYVQCRSLVVGNIKSLVRAEVRGVGWDPTDDLNKSIKQRIGSIRGFKMLKLVGFYKFLSLTALEWQLPHSTGGCNLEIHAYRGNKSIPGIFRMLQFSPNLEKLIVHFHESSYEDKGAENEAAKYDLNCDLFHLNTVNFKNFRNPNVDTGEAMQNLARFLVRKNIVLEKMVLDTPKLTTSIFINNTR